jgi:hypothetical protein
VTSRSTRPWRLKTVHVQVKCRQWRTPDQRAPWRSPLHNVVPDCTRALHLPMDTLVPSIRDTTCPIDQSGAPGCAAGAPGYEHAATADAAQTDARPSRRRVIRSSPACDWHQSAERDVWFRSRMQPRDATWKQVGPVGSMDADESSPGQSVRRPIVRSYRMRQDHRTGCGTS